MSSTITDDAIGQRLWDDAKAQALGTAKLAGPGPDQKQYTPEEELAMWNAEEKGWSIDQELALLASGKTREEVGLLKHPHRATLMKSGERALSKYAQAKYAADMARKADPTWQPSVPPGATDPTPGTSQGTTRPGAAPTATPTPAPTAAPIAEIGG